MGHKVGDRVGAIISVKNGKVLWLGEGVFEGYFPPPGTKPLTLEDAKEIAKEDPEQSSCQLTDEELQKRVDAFNESPFAKNPRIKLDNGGVAWGKECRWGDIAACKKEYDGSVFVDVRIERDEEGFFQRLVGDDGKEVPLDSI